MNFKKYLSTNKTFLILLCELAIVACCSLAIALHQFGIISDIDKFFFGSRNATWNLEQIISYLKVPFPKDATDIDYAYSSYLSNKNYFIKLSFKAPPSGTDAFTNALCYGFIHQKYNPFIATDVAADTPNAVLIQTEEAFYRYSSSPSDTPDSIFGNQCDDNGRGIVRFFVDRTDPNLYFVKFEIPRACNVATPVLGCSGHFIIPYAMGELVPDTMPVTIQPTAAKENSFDIPVEPGAKYEASVILTKPSTDSINEKHIHLMIEPYGKNCDGCFADIHGAVNSDGLKLSFIGSPEGKTYFKIFWFGNPGLCTVQVRKVG